ncbi:ankyrin repeat domain-containing protein [Simiduia curdlanivorans]|uniref:Ankyrin repeat domain-containing protein n=1 Tax=Simiduia curdlanivorans TaxID=1492769 RepID=A0ABV8V9K6_9GAMM|nr:ankyrin repeat domain-containing protein [Simiduia curdlanivorans]MDN3638756.1 ankyrin repeat domain-containing protein [Simiduia curdlanivorans]
MKCRVYFSAVVLLGVAMQSLSNPPAVPNADRMNQLINEMMQAQAQGDMARVEAIGREMEALSSGVQSEMSTLSRPSDRESTAMQERMQGQLNAMQAAANSPESRIGLAARKGDLTEVKRLAEAGANLNVYGINPGPPLMEAASEGHVDVAKYLLSKGAKLRVETSLASLDALHLAAQALEDNSAMIKLLVAAGALEQAPGENLGAKMLKESERQSPQANTVSAEQLGSDSALMAAIEKNRTKHVETLLALGANPNVWAHGKTALMLAARKLQPSTVRLLLSKGANAAETSPEHKTALQYAEETKETPQNSDRRRAVLTALQSI